MSEIETTCHICKATVTVDPDGDVENETLVTTEGAVNVMRVNGVEVHRYRG